MAIALLSLGNQSSGQITGQTGKPVVTADAPSSVQPPSEDKVPLVDRPLRLSDFTEGAGGMGPGEALAAKLTRVSGFIQNSPSDGKASTQATEVWLGRTSSAIYFAFICHDDHPSLIRTHLARRENILKDDNVGVLLDPFEDHRRGTLFPGQSKRSAGGCGLDRECQYGL